MNEGILDPPGDTNSLATALWLRLPQPQIGDAVALLRHVLSEGGRDLSREGLAARLCAVSTTYTAADATLIWRWETARTNPSRHYRQLLGRLAAAEMDRMSPATRREFLGQLTALAGVPLPKVQLPGWLDAERLADAVARPARLSVDQLGDLVALTHLYAEQGQQIGAAVLLPAVRDHLGRLAGLANGSHPDSVRRRFQAVMAETAVVAGRLAYRMEDRGEAGRYLRTGYELAVEAGEGWLQASALVHIGDLHSGVTYLGTQGGSPVTALAYMDRAADLDGADWPSLLRAWIFGCRAEELATLVQHDQALEAMETAQRAGARIGIRDVCPIVEIRPGDTMLAGFVGATELALGRADQAIAAFASGEASRPGSKPWLSGMAAGHALRGDVEQAAYLLARELDRAVARGLTAWRRRIEGVRVRHLSRWASSPAVRHLDEQLRAATL